MEVSRLIRWVTTSLPWRTKSLAVPSTENVGFPALEQYIARMEADALHKDSLYEDISALRVLAEQVLGKPAVIDQSALHSTMFDLPLNSVEAVVQMGLRRAVNARLMNDWYRDKLVFLINSEKSSSTLHEIIIRDMLDQTLGRRPNFGIQRGLRYGPTELASESAMHGLIPLYAPDGGVIRSPYLAFSGNQRYVLKLGSKVVLLCRHPADRLVARMCMHPDAEGAKKFLEDLENGVAFDSLLNQHSNSSLRYDLEWLAGWLIARDIIGGHLYVARYEDMVVDPIRHFDGIHRFLTGKPITSTLEVTVQDRMSRTKSGGDLQPGSVEGRSYPRGYSGKVGVWRNYLSEKDIAIYNQIVCNFLTYEPSADRMLRLYPDLLLDPADAQPGVPK